MATYYRRIWQDTRHAVATDKDSVAYTVTVDGTAVYTGRAYKRPGEDNIYIHLREIVKDYLSQSSAALLITGDSNLEQAPEAWRQVTLSVDGTDTGNVWWFLYDWSYSTSPAIEAGSEFSLGRPVNGHRVDGMTCLASALGHEGEYGVWNYCDAFSLQQYPTVVPCGSAVLHYINREGGWCSFLFEGLVKETDALTARTLDKGEAESLIDFASNRYGVDVQRKWTCTTGYLSDEESRRFAKDIVPTTMAFLDFFDATPIPVVVADTTVEVKTYESGGRKLVQYTINLAASQEEARQ